MLFQVGLCQNFYRTVFAPILFFPQSRVPTSLPGPISVSRTTAHTKPFINPCVICICLSGKKIWTFRIFLSKNKQAIDSYILSLKEHQKFLRIMPNNLVITESLISLMFSNMSQGKLSNNPDEKACCTLSL